MDERQATFAQFRVPDPGRIRKVHAWLSRTGRLDPPPERALRVLEIGYARGGLLDYLDGEVEKTALDLHPREIAEGTTFVQHDCNEDFRFAEPGSYDVVFAGEMIEHVFDDRRFVEQIHRILAPGGVLSLTTPNLFFLVNRIVMPFGRMPYFAYEAYHYHLYSKEILTALVSECGFDVARVTSTHVLVSSRRHRLVGGLCEKLGDVFPSLGAHLVLFATKR